MPLDKYYLTKTIKNLCSFVVPLYRFDVRLRGKEPEHGENDGPQAATAQPEVAFDLDFGDRLRDKLVKN